MATFCNNYEKDKNANPDKIKIEVNSLIRELYIDNSLVKNNFR